jgi:hypothetical protein
LEKLNEIKEVQFKKYNFITKTFINFSNSRHLVEKNWQFFNDKIIYHICPYIIMNNNEDITYFKNIDFTEWIKNYGQPRLSTNIFSVDSKSYLLFHSNINHSNYLKYFIGILRIENETCIPIDYLKTPLIESSITYSSPETLFNLWKWRNTKISPAIKYEVMFPMNVMVDDNTINIFSGINDCSAGIIKIKHNKTKNPRIYKVNIISYH